LKSSDDHPELRVFAQENTGTWGTRICHALRRFAPPWVRFVNAAENNTAAEAYDLAIMHEDCSTGTEHTYGLVMNSSNPVVVVQHCYKFHGGRGIRFEEMWQHALLTVSYHNLSAEATNFPFLHVPWGVDGQVFKPPAAGPMRKPNKTVVVFGMGREDHEHGGWTFDDESHIEVLEAAALAGAEVRHIGDMYGRLCGMCDEYKDCDPSMSVRNMGSMLGVQGPNFKQSLPATSAFARIGSGVQIGKQARINMDCFLGKVPKQCQKMPELGGKMPCDFHKNLGRISDEELIAELQAARYVSALRKFEGFEIPGIEALSVGTRPIIYDFIPGYAWYRKYSVEVTSLEPQKLVGQIRDTLLTEPKPLSSEELAELQAQFDWRKIVPRIFDTAYRELLTPRWKGSQAAAASDSQESRKSPLLRRGRKNDL